MIAATQPNSQKIESIMKVIAKKMKRIKKSIS